MGERKGITPVVAVTLLITVTVAASGAIYLQINQVQQNARQEANIFDQDQITIEACNSNPAQTTVYIRNSNTKAINTSKLKVIINQRPPEEDYSFQPQIVDPQRDFRLEIYNTDLNRSDLIEVIGRNNRFTYRCLN
ncbi:type IV pilin N-terminal domain-containing protein [Candidatus Nanohalovita haloferacivicina]|uniref:type IV pilin N-terminal domain-containing protein n=1 Tax=Candidatus Nanohalovita haloferacivicina TaxID=2978046 RepID=UPI00325FC74D|nr:hypothetical protein HBNXNv_0043 [Candidatus Nanohalobia archaeon BNXNv]